MIRSLFLILYCYGLLPLLIGVSIGLLKKHHISPSLVFISGYVIYLSLFDIIVIWGTYTHASFIHLARYWKVLILVLTILVLCSISISFFIIRKKNLRHTKMIPRFSRESLILMVLTVFLVFLAVLFLVPQAMDETPELARLSLADNTIFSLNPSTGSSYTASSAYPGYIHLFYAFGSIITRIDVTTLIHIVMPFFLIPLFVCIYVTIARILFPDEEKKRDRFRFVCLIILFYLLMLPLEAHIALAPYRNIWNGISLAASCLLPLFITVCLDLTRHFSTGSLTPVCSVSNTVIGLIFLLLAVRLCVPYGFVLCSLFVIATILIILAKVLRRKRPGSDSSPITEGGEQL